MRTRLLPVLLQVTRVPALMLSELGLNELPLIDMLAVPVGLQFGSGVGLALGEGLGEGLALGDGLGLGPCACVKAAPALRQKAERTATVQCVQRCVGQGRFSCAASFLIEMVFIMFFPSVVRLLPWT